MSLDKVTKGLLYYTDNHCQERIMRAVQHQLGKCRNGELLVSVSQYPMDFGENIVMHLERSIASMFRQMVVGLGALGIKKVDTVYCVEHDVLYHPSHFDFVPPRDDTFYFNKNVWSVNADTGEALHYDGMKKTSCLVAHTDLMIKHYTHKLAEVERQGWSNSMGFEPGKRKGNFEYFESRYPNVDIKWGGNIVRWRGKLEQYRCRERIKDSWMLKDSVPGWGVTKGRFDDFLRGVYVD